MMTYSLGGGLRSAGSLKKHKIMFLADTTIYTNKLNKVFRKGDIAQVTILKAYDESVEKCDIEFDDHTVAKKIKYDLFRFMDDSENEKTNSI